MLASGEPNKPNQTVPEALPTLEPMGLPVAAMGTVKLEQPAIIRQSTAINIATNVFFMISLHRQVYYLRFIFAICIPARVPPQEGVLWRSLTNLRRFSENLRVLF
jgi:hypothetical protein